MWASLWESESTTLKLLTLWLFLQSRLDASTAASIGLARAQMDPKEAQEAARKALQRDMKAKAAKAKAAKANAEKAAAAAAAAAAVAAESAAAEQQQQLHSLRKDKPKGKTKPRGAKSPPKGPPVLSGAGSSQQHAATSPPGVLKPLNVAAKKVKAADGSKSDRRSLDERQGNQLAQSHRSSHSQKTPRQKTPRQKKKVSLMDTAETVYLTLTPRSKAAAAKPDADAG